MVPQQPLHPRDWSWPFWPAVPLYPYGQRRTLRREIVKDTIWTFDQIQGILYTVVPIRMTVVKLSTGGLFVYAPVAPTPECVRLVNELVACHGDVRYIVLPTSSGLEHKVFVGPFARCFPQSQVYVAPHQWSFPLNLPLSWLGFPRSRTQVLPEDSSQAPFVDDFDYAVLDINLGRGSFAEVAFFHKRSATLLVIDSVLSVPFDPPAIVQLDPYPLLFHAREQGSEAITDNLVNRRKGWHRIALFAIYFRPSALYLTKLVPALGDALKSPNRSLKAYFGFFPFRWQENWQQSFDALRDQGMFVAPILQTLILPQAPQKVLDWVNQVASWDFHQIIPCHFDAPIKADPQQFRQCFTFLQPHQDLTGGGDVRYPAGMKRFALSPDWKFIHDLEAALLKRGIATPPREN